jgi:hypothetical protein
VAPPFLETNQDFARLSQPAANEWTVAIDLKLNMENSTGRGHLGAEHKSALLQDLQNESRGRPVSLVVQVSHPAESAGPGKMPALPAVSRFLIRDGTVTSLPEPAITDPSGLTGDLLRYAGSSQRSRNLGLIVFSHGFGSHGLGADGGKVSLLSLNSSLSSALSALHKDKLDLLAFDACSMAQTDTLYLMAPVARNLVASPEYMTCQKKESCGLNLNGWLAALLRKPQMSPNELSDEAVRQSQLSFERLGAGTASPAVVDFRLDERYEKFARALDAFASELTAALPHGKNRDALRQISQTTPEYERFYILDPPFPAPKDLLSFASSVISGVEHGDIADQSGGLVASSGALIQALGAMRGAYFGAHQNSVLGSSPMPEAVDTLPVRARVSYDRLGGLSISLPDDEQIGQANKDGIPDKQFIDNETVAELGKWRAFLKALRS